MTLLRIFGQKAPNAEPAREWTPFEAEIARELGGMEAYARSHGGTIALVSAERGREGMGDEVRVRLGGTCGGCPLSDTTLKDGVEAHLRGLFPGVRVLRVD